MADINKMLEEIKGMTVVELNQLVKAIEEEFGVSAAAPVAVAAAPVAGGAAPAAAEEEKTEFDVILTGIADASKKVAVRKLIWATCSEKSPTMRYELVSCLKMNYLHID